MIESPFGPVPGNPYSPWRSPLRWWSRRRAIKWWTAPVQNHIDYLTRDALYRLGTMTPEQRQQIMQNLTRLSRCGSTAHEAAVAMMQALRAMSEQNLA